MGPSKFLRGTLRKGFPRLGCFFLLGELLEKHNSSRKVKIHRSGLASRAKAWIWKRDRDAWMDVQTPGHNRERKGAWKQDTDLCAWDIYSAAALERTGKLAALYARAGISLICCLNRSFTSCWVSFSRAFLAPDPDLLGELAPRLLWKTQKMFSGFGTGLLF